VRRLAVGERVGALDVPLERLFVVPGNHDIARKTEEAAWKVMREKLAHGGRAASDWIAGGPTPAGFEDAWRDAVLQRQANFWKAVTELGRAELAPGAGSSRTPRLSGPGAARRVRGASVGGRA